MAVEVIAVRLQRARVALARRYLGLEALKPSAGDSVEPQPRRDRRDPGLRAVTSAWRSERASRRSDPTVRYESLPARRQQTAYFPFGSR